MRKVLWTPILWQLLPTGRQARPSRWRTPRQQPVGTQTLRAARSPDPICPLRKDFLWCGRWQGLPRSPWSPWSPHIRALRDLAAHNRTSGPCATLLGPQPHIRALRDLAGPTTAHPGPARPCWAHNRESRPSGSRKVRKRWSWALGLGSTQREKVEGLTICADCKGPLPCGRLPAHLLKALPLNISKTKPKKRTSALNFPRLLGEEDKGNMEPERKVLPQTAGGFVEESSYCFPEVVPIFSPTRNAQSFWSNAQVLDPLNRYYPIAPRLEGTILSPILFT
ncbi:uncharacterized protein LOC144365102 [Ictidomys tridecemlineatus]